MNRSDALWYPLRTRDVCCGEFWIRRASWAFTGLRRAVTPLGGWGFGSLSVRVGGPVFVDD
jgi:hypothetical protein